MMLLKVSATVTDYRGHHQTVLFLPVIISQFIMGVGIIRNNNHSLSYKYEYFVCDNWLSGPEVK